MTVNDVVVKKIFNSQTVAASGTADSSIYDIGAESWNRTYSMQIYVTGASASITASCLQSNNKSNFIGASGVSAICSNYPGAADSDYAIYSFSPVTARFMKIRLTETNGAEATVTAWMAMG